MEKNCILTLLLNQSTSLIDATGTKAFASENTQLVFYLSLINTNFYSTFGGAVPYGTLSENSYKLITKDKTMTDFRSLY